LHFVVLYQQLEVKFPQFAVHVRYDYEKRSKAEIKTRPQ